MHRTGNLCCTTGFCTVAYNACYISKCIINCALNYIHIRTLQESNTRSTAAGCTYSSTIGRQFSDKTFLIYGYQIAERKCPVHFLFIFFFFFGINYHGDTCGDPLITASGIDNHRHSTATHSRITSCCSVCRSSVRNAVPHSQHRSSDLRTVGVLNTLLRNRQIQTYLLFQHGFNILYVHGLCEFKNCFQIQILSIYISFSRLFIPFEGNYHLTIPFLTHNAGMTACNFHQSTVSLPFHLNNNTQILYTIQNP